MIWFLGVGGTPFLVVKKKKRLGCLCAAGDFFLQGIMVRVYVHLGLDSFPWDGVAGLCEELVDATQGYLMSYGAVSMQCRLCSCRMERKGKIRLPIYTHLTDQNAAAYGSEGLLAAS